MPTTVVYENDITVRKILTIENEPVLSVAFRDLQKENEKLEDLILQALIELQGVDELPSCRGDEAGTHIKSAIDLLLKASEI